jgi:hypothetical protein
VVRAARDERVHCGQIELMTRASPKALSRKLLATAALTLITEARVIGSYADMGGSSPGYSHVPLSGLKYSVPAFGAELRARKRTRPSRRGTPKAAPRNYLESRRMVPTFTPGAAHPGSGPNGASPILASTRSECDCVRSPGHPGAPHA